MRFFLVPRLCRADLGWNFYLGPANFREIAGEFLSEFWWRILSGFFGLVFPGFQATQKIHAQNSRPELSAFLSNFTFLNPKFMAIFCLRGRPKFLCPEFWGRILASIDIKEFTPEFGLKIHIALLQGHFADESRLSGKMRAHKLKKNPWVFRNFVWFFLMCLFCSLDCRWIPTWEPN